jgi:glycosyltransferase involved in cell wall biosynthesis
MTEYTSAPMHPSGESRRLRIAMVTETYLPEINGVAMTMGRLVDGLREREHTIQLIRPRQFPNEVPARAPYFEEVLHRGLAIPGYDVLKLGFPAKGKLLRLWKIKRPDVVHIVTEGPLGWSALSAARVLGIPVSSDFHTNFHAYSKHYGVGFLKPMIVAYLRLLHNRAHCTMVPTAGIREDLEQMGFDDLLVVARGVDTRLYNPARRSAELRRSWGVGPDDPVALYVGRLAVEKNLTLLLKSFETMLAANPRAQLVLVGDGPERAGLEARYPQYVFAGVRTGEDLAKYYASADIFIFPSVTETYGNVTMEAMASGLAVVAYNYAAAEEHIRHDHNGLAAPMDDSAAFLRLVAELTNDRGRIRRLAANARATTEGIDWCSIVSELERVLLNLSGTDAPARDTASARGSSDALADTGT